MTHRGWTVAAVATILLAACGGSDTTASTTASSAAPTSLATSTAPAPETSATDAPTTEGVVTTEADAAAATTKTVPEDYATIQEAVDAASPGDLILVEPGTYNEAVTVETDDLTIRGLDRNEVVLDGKFELDNGIRVVGANGVAVENMTATNYTSNGFFWTGVDGYRGSYLTAYRTGDYGVYAFDSVTGQLDHIYAAGSPDAGIYIGECYPCDAVIDGIVSEHNGLGYSGTNSGGNLLIVNSIFRFNRAGIVPNSGSYELCYPGRQTTIVGNIVYSNNQADTPAIDVALLAMGNGILSAGSVLNNIERNLVYDHDKSGIGLVPFLEEDPNDVMPTQAQWSLSCEDAKDLDPVIPDGPLLWESQQTRVIGNVVSDSRQADIINASVSMAEADLGNCFSGNTYASTAPNNLETLAPCDGTGTGDWADGKYNILSWLEDNPPPSVDWQTAVLPPLQPQENMPDVATAPARPATDVPYNVDLAAITVPAKPAG